MATGETKWRCPVIVESLEDNKPRRCVQVYRKNAIPKTHIHYFPLARDVDKGFPSDYIKKNKKFRSMNLKIMLKI